MEVRPQEQFEEATQFRLEFGRHIWLGGSDSQEEGVWVWDSNGQGINMEQFWILGEPTSSYGAEDCLEIVVRDNASNIGLNDAWCGYQRYSICEMN